MTTLMMPWGMKVAMKKVEPDTTEKVELVPAAKVSEVKLTQKPMVQQVVMEVPKVKRGRPTLGPQPMTKAEMQARWRAKRKAETS